MSKIFYQDWNCVLADIVGEFDVTDDYTKADAVVCWNDTDGYCREIINNANFLGIPTMVVQHGLRATREYVSPFNKPLLANKIMVWGPNDKARLLKAGIQEDRIEITGTTIFDHLIPRKSHEGINVVFPPMHWDRDLEENYLLAKKLREIPGINVITKLIDGMNGSQFDNPVFSNRNHQEHLQTCASILSTADIIIGINESTFEYLAYYLDIPVITVDLWKPKYFRDRLFFSEIRSDFSRACQVVNLNELSDAVEETIEHPEKYESDRKLALLQDAGVGWNDFPPKRRIINAIRQLFENKPDSNQKNFPVHSINIATNQLLKNLLIAEQNCQVAIAKNKEDLEAGKVSKRILVDQLSTLQNAKPIFNILDYALYTEEPNRLLDTSAWIEHVPFGMFLIELIKPKVLVELGTHSGVSYCCFCQAVKTLGLNTRCYAVDTWTGDEHAGFYDSSVIDNLRSYHDPLYGEFSQLLQTTFDDAKKYFSDGSIDLLHIDGLHTYEAVKHDFENWLPKLSTVGVVIFHDINVKEREFGVWKFWEEIRKQYSSFEFYHGHGLGILFVGTDIFPPIEKLINTSDDQAQIIRKFFHNIGSKYSERILHEYNISQIRNSYDEIISSKDNAVQEREKVIREQQLANQDLLNQVENIKRIIQDQEEKNRSLLTQIENQEEKKQDLLIQIEDQEKVIQEREKTIVEQSYCMEDQKKTIQEREEKIEVLKNSNLELISSLESQKLQNRQNMLQLSDVRQKLFEFENSKAYGVALKLRNVRAKLIPYGSKREKIIRSIYRKLRRRHD